MRLCGFVQMLVIGMLDSLEIAKIENFILSIGGTEEYKEVSYLVHSIRRCYLDYLSRFRLQKFQIPAYLQPLHAHIKQQYIAEQIDIKALVQYMLENDPQNWFRYYFDCYICPLMNGQKSQFIDDGESFFFLVLTGYILDNFNERYVDIRKILEGQKLLGEPNQYGLSVVNGVKFHRDSFIYNDKAYLYNVLTETNILKFSDNMPAFARVITDEVKDGNILLRLDERLALPLEDEITYSTSNFEKFRGPQFDFDISRLSRAKTITVHYTPTTMNKLLMVIKKDFDNLQEKEFLHIELETLPYVKEDSHCTHVITTFLHGMYYPSDDIFKHIDFTRNQYDVDDYRAKQSDASEDKPIDFYAPTDLHYKIWCIENGKYSRDTWYKLMIVSLTEEYQKLFNEMLAGIQA